MTTTIAFSNQKGGVAKTTSCLSLGASLAQMGHPTLLVDLDPQANLTISLGLKPKSLRRSLIDTLMGNSPLVGVSRETGILALDIVPANAELALTEKILYRRKGYQYRLRQVLDQTPRDLYDYILLDCPPSLAPLTLNALTAADLLVVPTQCEFFSAHSLSQTIRLALQIRQQSNARLLYRVLITMYDKRNKIHRLVLEQMRRGLSTVLFRTMIQVDTKLRESPAYGQPITTYAPRSRGSLQYRALARELREPDLARLLARGRVTKQQSIPVTPSRPGPAPRPSFPDPQHPSSDQTRGARPESQRERETAASPGTSPSPVGQGGTREAEGMRRGLTE
jgi:chromosome partitioning protein